MIMVGGGAVNFHGYQRHSLDVDFWLESVTENFNKLVTVFRELGYEIEDLPEEVKKLQQNISLNSKRNGLEWCVLSFEDLITRKIKAGRPKDLLDIQELQRIKNNLGTH